jgi:hypothetical protein
MQDGCTVCTKRTIGSEIVLYAPDGTVMWVMSNIISVHLETVLLSVQDRCTVCNKHINHFDAPDGSPR